MKSKALRTLALVAQLPSSGRPEDVEIATFWGWHYLIAIEDGHRDRICYRVSIDGERYEHCGELEILRESSEHFVPTAAMLGIREA